MPSNGRKNPTFPKARIASQRKENSLIGGKNDSDVTTAGSCSHALSHKKKTKGLLQQLAMCYFGRLKPSTIFHR